MAFISSSNSVDSNRWAAASYCEVLTHALRRFKTLQHCLLADVSSWQLYMTLLKVGSRAIWAALCTKAG